MLVFAMLVSTLAQAARGPAEVAATRHFVFYSDPRANLHDELNRLSRSDEATADAAECLAGLPEESRTGWDEALSFYRERLAELFLRGDEMVAVRARLLGLDDPAGVDGVLLDAIFAHLERARPAYETCLWQERDRRNRAWIDAVVPSLREHEEILSARLAELFQHDWPGTPIPIDVVGWVSDSGANSIDEPAHVMMSSENESYRGDAALEMVFHEASHLLIDSSYGEVSQELRRANAGRMLPRRDLWHTILFFTVGQVTKERLAEAGVAGYVPYVYAQGLFDRGWRPYRVPLEDHWQPYLDGAIPLATAVERLIEAIHAR